MEKEKLNPYTDYLDDNVVIPEDIKKMSLEELRKAISDELEKELKAKKQS